MLLKGFKRGCVRHHKLFLENHDYVYNYPPVILDLDEYLQVCLHVYTLAGFKPGLTNVYPRINLLIYVPM